MGAREVRGGYTPELPPPPPEPSPGRLIHEDGRTRAARPLFRVETCDVSAWDETDPPHKVLMTRGQRKVLQNDVASLRACWLNLGASCFAVVTWVAAAFERLGAWILTTVRADRQVQQMHRLMQGVVDRIEADPVTVARLLAPGWTDADEVAWIKTGNVERLSRCTFMEYLLTSRAFEESDAGKASAALFAVLRAGL